MTFTRSVREELAHLKTPRICCERAEMAGIARAAGSAHLLAGGAKAIEIEVEDPAVVRRIYAAVSKELTGVEVRLFEPARGRPHPRFVVRAEGDIDSWLYAVGLTDHSGRPADPSKRLAAKRCDAGAYLRGAFLARGSASEPRAAVHLEFRLPTGADAGFVRALLDRLRVSSSVREHKAATVVTIKDVAGAGSVLAAMGAHGAYLAWEDGTVWKSVRGEANRLANCDTANARRTAVSAEQQLRDIGTLDDAGMLQRLPSALREAADLRREHRDSPIDELARLAHPPVTKAAMADRLRRLGRHASALVG